MTIGDRVRLNAIGLRYYPTAKPGLVGVVVGRSRPRATDPHLSVLWEGLKTPQPWLVEFLELAE